MESLIQKGTTETERKAEMQTQSESMQPQIKTGTDMTCSDAPHTLAPGPASAADAPRASSRVRNDVSYAKDTLESESFGEDSPPDDRRDRTALDLHSRCNRPARRQHKYYRK